MAINEKVNPYWMLIGCSSLLLSNAALYGDQIPPTQEMTAGYNESCRIAVDRPYDFFAGASFTYWQPMQENMQLGVVSDATGSNDLFNGREVDLDLDFKPGFKVGIGMNFDYDKWNTALWYTWFRGTEHAHEKVNTDTTLKALYPSWQIPSNLNPRYQSGSESWRLKMDLVDWDLARGMYVGKKLCFRPFMGVRLAFIRQHLHVKYENSSALFLSVWPSTSITQNTDSWGLGPRVGIDANWNMGAGCRIYGLAEFDTLFTQYDVKSRQSSSTNTASVYSIHKDNINALRVHTELALGFGWGTYFCNKKYHTDLSADYSFQAFFNQNMFRTFNNTQAPAVNTLPNGNLYLQGLTVTCRLDF